MLIKPLISEKSLALAKEKKYTFKVDKSANKPQIKKGVEDVFEVKVLKVQTVSMPGKTYRSGRKWIIRKRANWKKAIVTIQPDKNIDLFETTGTEK